MTNPTLKKGQEVLIMECNNGQIKELEGQVFTVYSATSQYINVRTKTGASYNFYTGTGGQKKDYWCQPTKESKIKFYESLISENNIERDKLSRENVDLEKKLHILKNYESEEEYLLEQLDVVLLNPSTTKKKARIEALKLIREGKIL